MKSDTIRKAVESILVTLAKTDPKSIVRAKAIGLLGSYRQDSLSNIFSAGLHDSSYQVAGAALTALSLVDSLAAFNEAKNQMRLKSKRELTEAILVVLMQYGSEDQFNYIADNYPNLPFVIPNKTFTSIDFLKYLERVHSDSRLIKGVDLIVLFRDQIPDMVAARINPGLEELMHKKELEGLKDQANYIRSKLPK